MGHGDTPPPGQQAPYPPAAGAALGASPPAAGAAGPYPAASPAAAAAAGAAAPYPPAQPGMTLSPGGYPVMSPGQHGAGPSSGAPPSGYHPSAMEPPTKPHAMGPPPSGYPGAGPAPYPPPHGGPAPYPPPGGYPPQGAAGPAPGYPVMGTPAAAGAAAMPVGGMYMEQGAVVDPGKEKCACSVGWVLFGVGFIFWPCWVAAAFVPLCTRNRNDRLAGIASTIGMLCLVILGIIIGVTSSSRRTW